MAEDSLQELLEQEGNSNVLVEADPLDREPVYDELAEYAEGPVLADAPTDAHSVEASFRGSDLRMIVNDELDGGERVASVPQVDLTAKGIHITEDIEERGGEDYILLMESPNAVAQHVGDDERFMKYLKVITDRVRLSGGTGIYVESPDVWSDENYSMLQAIMDDRFDYSQ